MKTLKALQLIAIAASLIAILVKAQISTPCTVSMISSFTPCINYITGSSNNGSSSPTRSCCNTLRSMMGTSMDCACLVVNANVPFQLPFNKTLALSLPQACNMGGVPVQCKATGSPLPAPGPVVLLGPSPSPIADSPFSPQASKAAGIAAVPAPQSEPNLAQSPRFTPDHETLEAPVAQTGIRPVLTPTSSSTSSSMLPFSSLLFKLVVPTIIFMSYS